MIKKRKIGIILILIGIGVPLVLFFFQEDGVIYTVRTKKIVERKLSPKEVITLESELKKLTFKEYLEIEKQKKKIITTEELFEQVAQDAKKELIFDMFGKNHFNKEKWTIYTFNELSIPYRQTLGVGILFIFIGIGIFVFSFFPKETNSEKQNN